MAKPGSNKTKEKIAPGNFWLIDSVGIKPIIAIWTLKEKHATNSCIDNAGRHCWDN